MYVKILENLEEKKSSRGKSVKRKVNFPFVLLDDILDLAYY